MGYRMIEVSRSNPAPIVVCVIEGTEVECVTSVMLTPIVVV